MPHTQRMLRRSSEQQPRPLRTPAVLPPHTGAAPCGITEKTVRKVKESVKRVGGCWRETAIFVAGKTSVPLRGIEPI